MQKDLIGPDGWDCCGHVLTPAMRRDILAAAAEMYVVWHGRGVSCVWDRAEGRLVPTSANEVNTIGEFLAELTGGRRAFDGTEFPDHSGEFYDWLKDYLCESWGDGLYEEDESGTDPMNEAEQRVFGWLNLLPVLDVVAWWGAQRKAATQSSDQSAGGTTEATGRPVSA